MGKQWKQWQTLFWGAQKSLQMVSAATKLKDTCSLEVKLCKHRQCIKKQRYYSAEKTLYSQRYVSSSNHIWMWELDHKEGIECIRIDACELWRWRRLESPLDCKEIKTVNPKGNQFWILIRKTDAEALAEAPIRPPGSRSRLIRKDPDAVKDWRQGEEGMKEDVLVGWHHWLNGCAFEQAPRGGRAGEPGCHRPRDSK